jgi:hypothetical protein
MLLTLLYPLSINLYPSSDHSIGLAFDDSVIANHHCPLSGNIGTI